MRRAVGKSLSRYNAPTRASKASSSAPSAGPTAGGLLAGAQPQAGVEADFPGDPGQKNAVGEGGAALAEHAFAVAGEEIVERLREDELQHGIAEKLEALVALGGIGVVLQIRRVRDGALQQRRIAERVGEAGLELFEGGTHELALL
jgi:hypothetical protein